MSLVGVQLGHYRLKKLIGTGGMGEVYLAEDTRIARQVAIKVVRSDVEAYPGTESAKEATRLFQREMKAITRLDHPHILPLYDFGEERLQKDTLAYMVMPFRPEGSLADWLQERGSSTGRLSLSEVAHLVQQAAEALQHAHENQLVHQDVKPGNFLLRRKVGTSGLPDLLLADFGVAKFTNATTTTSQTARGTPAYMAPEQWEGQPIPATDQYALAVMAYQLLTGRPPFVGRLEQVMYQHLRVQPQHRASSIQLFHQLLKRFFSVLCRKSQQSVLPPSTTFRKPFSKQWQEVAVCVRPSPSAGTRPIMAPSAR